MPLHTFLKCSSPAALVTATFAACPALAQTYTLTDLSPAYSVESFFRGAGSNQATGSVSVLLDPPPFPDARRTYAVLWDQTTQTFTSLDPGPEYSASWANRARNGQQVGYGFTSGPNLALLWTGSAASAIVLNSPGTDSAVANDTDGSMQVGAAISNDLGPLSRAWVWEGSAASGRSIHPEGVLNSSTAYSIRDGKIVGTGEDFSELLVGVYWPSATADAIVIRPDGFDETTISDLAGDYAFGDGAGSAVGNARHALLFDLADPQTWIDIHPADPAYTNSYASAALRTGPGPRDFTLIGAARFEAVPGSGEAFEHACAWLGTDTFVDLHTLLPQQFVLSIARGIDDAGNIYGWATDLNGAYIAVRWSPVATCPADFNADGFLDFFDYSDFVEAFESGQSLAADFNRDGFIDFFDYSDFVEAFETGC